MADIAQQTSPPIAADAVSLTVMAEAAPHGMALSYLEAVASSTTFDDFSGACMLAIAAPSGAGSGDRPPDLGTGGPTGHSGMSMSAPAAPN